MRTIGLIGGMSWESTTVYYRLINEGIRDAQGGLASANLIIHSLDFSEVVALQKADRWEQAGVLLGNAGARLATAGADSVLICTNTMHLVADPVARMSNVPLIDIIDETAKALLQDGYRRPLLLATRYTMEHGFYTDRMAAMGLDVILPDDAGRSVVHSTIFDELCQGVINDEARVQFMEIIAAARSRGADSVILGCTEISLLVDPNATPLPGYDSTQIHAKAAIQFALNAEVIPRVA